MLHLAAPEDDGDLNFVIMFEKLACLVDLGVDIVVVRLGANANFLQLLLADLAGFVSLLRSREPQLAIIEDPAHGRSLVGGHLYQIQASLPRFGKGLKGWYNAQLFSFDADESDGRDADLFVDSRATVLRCLTIKKSNIQSP